jgi:hypothetical protein
MPRTQEPGTNSIVLSYGALAARGLASREAPRVVRARAQIPVRLSRFRLPEPTAEFVIGA